MAKPTISPEELGIAPIDQATNMANKRAVWEAMATIAGTGTGGLASRLESIYHRDVTWRGSHPMNEVSGITAIEETAWLPVLTAFPDLERRDDILMGGHFRGRDIVAACGHYLGTFKKPWFGIPPTGQPIFIRYGEVHELDDDGRIIRSSCIWDMLDVMRQAGYWPIAPSWGTECMWPGPITADGLLLAPQDEAEGRASIIQTLEMHKTLGDHDDETNAGRRGLIDMPQKHYWHEKMMWYGPAGIGTNRGLEGFVDFHQLPFRLVWPNRRGGSQKSSNPNHGHYIRIGDGHYSATAGWPSVIAQHIGTGELFGTGATGKTIEMRVMDFYNHHEGKIRENWVPIDIPHILLQMGIDVFDRMNKQFGPNRLGL